MSKDLRDKLISVTKWICLVGLPGVIVLIATLGSIWGWGWATQVCATLSAIDACLGTFVGIHSNKEASMVDGGLVIDDDGNTVDIVADEPGKKIAEGKTTVKLRVMKDSENPYGE